jgi:hypothetical protein
MAIERLVLWGVGKAVGKLVEPMLGDTVKTSPKTNQSLVAQHGKAHPAR